jgi:hypothetical protein
MNERIKQLAEQATLAVTKPDGHYIVQAWQAKFAELIVKECAEIIEQDGFYISSPTGEKKPCNPFEISDMVKEHFGVEE